MSWAQVGDKGGSCGAIFSYQLGGVSCQYWINFASDRYEYSIARRGDLVERGWAARESCAGRELRSWLEGKLAKLAGVRS